MDPTHRLLAEKLLRIGAIKLQPDSPFVWASGWTSPIYADLRITLSYPEVRNLIKVEVARMILERFGQAEVVASVSTGAIAHGVLAADALALPFAYVRSKPKDHGLENLIEGNIKPGQRVVMVEDLVSTGSNSLKAAQTIAMAGGEVVGMVVMFSFEFPDAERAFADAGVPLCAICGYSAMLEAAVGGGMGQAGLDALRLWHQAPEHWSPSKAVD